MKAVILGGRPGTTLNLLRRNVPRCLVHFANKPIILHQIEALKAVGVDEVIVAIKDHSEVMVDFKKDIETELGIKISCSVEAEPLGTAGPLALVKDKLIENSEEPFFVLNDDIIFEYQLMQLIDFHRGHAGEASILVTKVSEPSKYGVAVIEETTGQVQEFVEKPPRFIGDKINAGIYLMNTSILDGIELKHSSMEKEVFPKLAAEKKLYAKMFDGFWMDITKPKDYIVCQALYLESLRIKSPDILANGPIVEGNVLIHDTAQIGEECLIGPNVVIGRNCIIERGIRLKDCTVMEGVHIKRHSAITRSIIGWNSFVGEWSRLVNAGMVGEEAFIHDEVLVEVL